MLECIKGWFGMSNETGFSEINPDLTPKELLKEAERIAQITEEPPMYKEGLTENNDS